MKEQLVPRELLCASKNILFIIDQSTTSFIYLHNYFAAFKQTHPHIAVDVLIMAQESSWFFWRKPRIKKHMLVDWLTICPFFDVVYSSSATYSESFHKEYTIIVSLSNNAIGTSIKCAKQINPQAFIVAQKKTYGPLNHIIQQSRLKKIDQTFTYEPQTGNRLSDVYAVWFKQLFNIELALDKQTPSITIPHTWLLHAKLQFLKWNISKKNNVFSRVILINTSAKNKYDSWGLVNTFELIKTIKKIDQWGDLTFLIVAKKEEMNIARTMAYHYALTNTHIISTDLNFFQLPAFISISDIVISVESATMHLADICNIPLIALIASDDTLNQPRTNNRVTVLMPIKKRIKSLGIKEVADAILAHPRLQPSLSRAE